RGGLAPRRRRREPLRADLRAGVRRPRRAGAPRHRRRRADALLQAARGHRLSARAARRERRARGPRACTRRREHAARARGGSLMAEIVMPRLSDTMEEGTILRWLKRDGEHVGRGEELVEIETDKAAMIYESDEEGVLEIGAAEGDTLPVGTTIAHVASGADLAASTSGAAGETAPDGGRPPAQADAAARAQPETAPPAIPAPTPQPSVEVAAEGVAGTAAAPSTTERVKASPLARRIARERDVDL